MAKRFYGSIDYSLIVKLAKEGHSAVGRVTKKDGSTKVCIDVTAWVNDEPDKFGNKMQITVSARPGGTGGKEYIGNLKEADEAKPVLPGEIGEGDDNV